MGALADGIRQHKNRVCEALHIGYANWDDLLDRIERQERTKCPDFADEQVWTFLVGCAYAMQGLAGTGKLAQLLTGADPARPTKAWFEVLPLPPREREGNTHLDLALGSIALRSGTQSGIELSKDERSWVSFVECKWYSDIAGLVSYDKHRNQLARVIENAVYFNKGDRFAREAHVTLVTPEVFKTCPASSRLYQYKYSEYSKAETCDLVRDLAASCLPHRRQFPDIHERLRSLRLHWVTYETLFQTVPDSELKQPFLDFAGRFNGTKSDHPREAEG